MTPPDLSQLSPLKRALLAIEKLEDRLATVEAERRQPVAVIGLGCRFPGGADSPAAFWRLLAEGTDAVTAVPPDRWDAAACYDPDREAPGKMTTRHGAFLTGIDRFDARFFGISPAEASAMDPQQRLWLEVAWEALEDAGQPPRALAGAGVGVFVGIAGSDSFLHQHADPERIGPYTGTGTSHSVAAGRLSYLLDLRGPSLAVDTACSSSLVAIHLACQSLRSGECSLAVAGGVHLLLGPEGMISVSKMGLLAADGRCKTFDARADGVVLGEGCGAVVLKRLSEALADGDRIWAVLRGSAVNQDGLSAGLTAPSGPAQQEVVRRALENAGVAPAEVAYVETHGTGTALGDPIEVEALAEVLGCRGGEERPCVLGALKTQLGHLAAASGVAGLIKAILCLRHGEIPANLHLRELNPNLPLAHTRFALPKKTLPWPPGGTPRRAGVSSFGWSGTNCHVVLAEAPAFPDPPREAERSFLLPLSARDPQALAALAERYRDFLAPGGGGDSLPLRDLACTAALRRGHHEHRLAVVGSSPSELAAALAAAVRPARTGLATRRGGGDGLRGAVFVFSGHGSQWPGMGRDLLAHEPVFREVMEACEQSVRAELGWSLLDALAGEGSCAEAHRVQPALFAVSLGLAALWRSWGVEPAAVVGHSFGEVAAACTAGALGRDEALRIVCRRSPLLQRVSGRGGMVVVEAGGERVEEVLAGDARLAIAALNGPRSTAVAGDPEALDRFLERCAGAGLPCRRAQADVAFHSAQMDPLCPELRQALAGLRPRPASVPFYSAVAGRRMSGEELDAAYWARNLRQPALFWPAIRPLLERFDVFLEISPHPVLLLPLASGLHDLGGDSIVLPSLERGRDGRTVLLESLGALYTAGWPVDWRRLFPQGGRCVSLPSYPWTRERFAAPVSRRRRREAAAPARDPLLGSPLDLAHPACGPTWEAELSPEADLTASLYEHRLLGFAILPAAALLQAALAAAGATFPGGAGLTGVELRRPVVLPESAPLRLQLSLTDTGVPTGPRFHLSGRPGDAGAGWTLHACGRITPGRDGGPTPPEPEPPEEIRRRCPEEISMESAGRGLASSGIVYGADLWALDQAWQGTGEALARVRDLAGGLVDRWAGRLPPALLDSCFQLAAVALQPEAGEGNGYVPVYLERLQVQGEAENETGGGRLWSHLRLRAGEERGAVVRTADLWLRNGDGRAVVAISDLVLHRMEHEALLRAVASMDGGAAQPPREEERGALERRLRAAPVGERWAVLVSFLRSEVASVLGFASSAAVDPGEGFFQLGMDSIGTLRLRDRLQVLLGCSLRPTVAFEHSTVEALARYLAGEALSLELAPPSSPSRPAGEGRDALRSQVRTLSDREMAALLEERLNSLPGGGGG